MVGEIKGSQLEFRMLGLHPLFKPVLDIVSGRRSTDRLPVDGIDMTVLVNVRNEFGITLAFGLEQLLDMKISGYDSMLTSIWTPKLISEATHYEYIIQRFDHE